MEHKRIITNWKEFELPKVVPRLAEVDLTSDFIITITGPRRAGKTYFCFQLIQKLLADGISKENVLYINFEDNKLLGANADDLDRLFESFLELSEVDKKQKIYLFFDEIQTVSNWDAWVRTMHDTERNVRLIITGSSSKLLSREISTKLRGRVINQEIFPLSFKELVKWNGMVYNIKTITHSKQRIVVKKLFSRFITNGGYPALFVNKDIPAETILQSYYDSMILKDIVERYRIEDVKKLQFLSQLLFQSVSHEMSYTNLANRLKAIGFKISKNTIIEYLSYFEDAYLFFQNMKYEYSLAQQMGSIKKVYCIDTGLLRTISFKFSENWGKLLENVVFIELKRKKMTTYYHRKKGECDFLIVKKNKVQQAIQVTTILNEQNEEREIQGLLEVLKEHNLEKGLIVTEDQEGTRIVEGKKIVLVPIWKWLLEE